MKYMVHDELVQVHGFDGGDRHADIIFVHGLNGNAYDYWCHEGKEENYWPAWLAQEFPKVGVWALSYENAAFKSRWFLFSFIFVLFRIKGFRGFSMPLSDRAKTFQLQLENNGIGNRPIVFIAHSMGGLLVKQLLQTAKQMPDEQQTWKSILKNTRGVCFVATPHIGSDLAKWATYFRFTLQANVAAYQLRPHNDQLLQLNESYISFVNDKKTKVHTLSFVEMRPTVGDTLVVDQGDATIHVVKGETYPVNEDHSSICKPHSKKADIFVKVNRFIKEKCIPGYAIDELTTTEYVRAWPPNASMPRPSTQSTRRKWLKVAGLMALCSVGVALYFYGRIGNSVSGSKSDITFAQVTGLMTEKEKLRDWSGVRNAIEDKIVTWSGVIVKEKYQAGRNSSFYTIKSIGEPEPYQFAIFGLMDSEDYIAKEIGDTITLEGKVNRVSDKGIIILDAKIVNSD